ncbi:MAG: class I tRNA ligase family protein [Candidatus Pacebacteria bacterium]|nr:class I tRNA ligase family protein [Candidatus Paceibacterota bacterium]
MNNEKNTSKSASAEREEKIIEFWRENNTFKKSLEKEAPKGNYVFYDGPPFATGLPHYGHILGSTAKDVIGRYQTMQGFRVPRRWGWDCHGLPIENIVEKDLGLSGHVEIEKLGVDKFVEHARSKVLTYVSEWKRTVERIGRWVDFDGSYKTMDNTFIESVWWALGQMNDKGLIYEGVRVLAYCPRCETPIAKSEIAMDNSYKDIADISVYVNMPLVDPIRTNGSQNEPTSNGAGDPITYMVAWTTTPWSLPGNIVLAVNAKETYVKVKVGQHNDIIEIGTGEKNGVKTPSNIIKSGLYIVAKDRVETVFKDFPIPYEIVEEFLGEKLLGKKYTPPFDYYTKGEALLANSKSWTVVHADFVTTTDGTGIAHEAPAFGEDDATLAQKEGIPFIVHVTPEGKFAPEVTDFAGMPIKPKSTEKDGHMKADIEVLKYLQAKGSLFKKEKIMHSYPHCYRCETPLFYYALPSWFINIQKAKTRMLETAKDMAWIPEHLKEGRFKNTMEGAPDWNISRNRYWASPLPFWKSVSGKFLFVNSIEDLKAKTKKSGNTYTVLRHGEGEHNLTGKCSFADEKSVHLTEKGKSQAESAGEKLKSKKIDYIFVSPFTRTTETAKIVQNILGISSEQVIFDDRLIELDPGIFDGKTWAEHEAWSNNQENFFRATPEGGESRLSAKIRFGNFLYEIEEKYKNKNILIVSHGISLETLPTISECCNDVRGTEIYRNYRHEPGDIMDIPFVRLPHNANYELDLHRPYIDAVMLVDENGEEYHRIPEVIDCWFESGSMPFAQDHYMGDSKDNWKDRNFPAGFVAEYIAQTRTWFYYTHAISTVLFDGAPFKNVVTTGTLLAEDGQKMSKSKNNFPDPWVLFDKYGVDPLRLYLMSCPLMKGEDANFSEKTVQDIASKLIGRLLNVLAFYELYRDQDLERKEQKEKGNESTNVLDVWILSRLNQLVDEVTKGMNAYDMTEATRPFDLFVDDLSTWYLRRSRDRVKDGDADAKKTLYTVFKTVAKLLAPLAPFTAEDIWQRIKNDSDAESVHLADWPMEQKQESGSKILEEMQEARNITSVGLQLRQKAGIPVRQPLLKLSAKSFQLKASYREMMLDELNIKDIVEDKNIVDDLVLDMTITPELKREGDYRELVREIQELRKTEGLMPSDVIELVLPKSKEETVKGFEADLKKVVSAEEILFQGEQISLAKK